MIVVHRPVYWAVHASANIHPTHSCHGVAHVEAPQESAERAVSAGNKDGP